MKFISKKKILVLFTILSFSISFFSFNINKIFAAPPPPFSGSGNGTVLHPYLVTTCNQFLEINNHLFAHYQLSNDLTCTSSGNFSVASFPSNGFSGTFDGNSHNIDYLYDAGGDDYVGLFRYINGGTVENLSLNTNFNVGGHNFVGALAGYVSYGTIDNVTSTANVSGTSDVGGLIGYAEFSSATNSSSSGSIASDFNAGGLIGSGFDLDIENINNTTNVNSFGGGFNVGGIIGYLDTSSVESIFLNVNENGSITTNAAEDVGGLIGYAYTEDTGTLSISNSSYKGSLIVNNSDTAGGLIGYAENASFSSVTSLNISGSNASGSLTGSSDQGYFGGLIGVLDRYDNDTNGENDVNILNNYSDIDISSSSDFIGGLIGYIIENSQISDNLFSFNMVGNYSIGAITSLGGSVGGLVGEYDSINQGGSEIDETINKNYSTSTVSGDHDVGGLFGYFSSSDFLNGTPSNINFTENYFTGSSVSSSSNGFIGGLFGYFNASGTNVKVSDSYANTQVTGVSFIGGLIGEAYGVTLSRSYSAGSVSGTDINASQGAGGLLGAGDNNDQINDSFSTSYINNFNTGFGGLVGYVYSITFNNSFFDGRSTGQANCSFSGAVSGCTDSNQGPSYFKNTASNAPLNSWDFSNIWDSTIGNYPTLHNISADDTSPMFDGGDGVSTPYIISTCQQFENINNDLTASYVLNNDLLCASEGGNIMIGDSFGAPFIGSFDGQNHSIDIDIAGPYFTTSLFSVLHNASVSNLNITGSIDSVFYTGSLASAVNASSLINNVHSSVNITLEPNSGSGIYAGGLVGILDSSLVEYSSYTGDIILNDGSPIDTIGGIAGFTNNATIGGDYSTGHITVNKTSLPSGAGGLVGFLTSNSGIYESYSTTIVNNASSNTGGLVGVSDGTSGQNVIFDSYAKGNINGTDVIGGLIGYSFATEMQNTYATGNVTGNGNTDGGGLVGKAEASLVNYSFAVGNVSNFSANAGGVVGNDKGGNTFILDRFDFAGTGQSFCIGSSSTSNGDCTDDGSDINYFKGISNSTTSQPILNWDFIDIPIWVATDGFYPTLNILSSDDPVIFEGGDGSSGNPYQISSCDQLQNINNDLTANYVLINSIDCTDSIITPIGLNIDPFSGTFNGQGFNINNLTINQFDNPAGLFSQVNGLIKNVTLKNENVNGKNNVGGVAGVLSGGSVINNVNVGGIINGDSYVGGIAGTNSNSTTIIVNSSSSAEVNGTYNIGGLIGNNQDGNISTSFATGDVNGFWNVGGLVGFNIFGSIYDSYATGQITGTITVGGLVGDGSGSIVKDSYSAGSVIGNGFNTSGTNSNVGGLIGYSSGDAKIIDSFTTSPVLFIYDGINTQSIPLTNDTYIGNFIGNNDNGSTFIHDYYEQSSNGQNFCMGDSSAGGQGGSNISGCFDEGGDLTNFQGNNEIKPLGNWNFDNTWNVVVGDYPSLQRNSIFTGATIHGVHVITSCAEFEEMNNYDLSSSSFKLVSDLDCTSEGNNIMVGTDIPFSGNLLGRGHTLTIDIDDTSSLNVGVFQNTLNAVIQDFKVSGNINSAFETGSLIGNATNTNISNVSSSVNITLQSNNGFNSDVGGLIGYISVGSLYNSFNTGTITINSDSSASTTGGLVGYADSMVVSNSYNTGNIDSEVIMSNCGIGGLFGCLFSSNISESYSTGNLTGFYDIGGFVGGTGESSFTDSYSSGNITVNGGGSNFGGFAGWSNVGIFSNVYSSGNLDGQNLGSNTVGGFMGASYHDELNNLFSAGGIMNFSGLIGGLIGFELDAGNTNYNNVYYESGRSNNITTCDSNINPDGCNFIDYGFNDQFHFVGISANSNTPMNSGWDFVSTWATTNNYPVLRAFLFDSGDGSIDDPYQISTCQQLQNMNLYLDAKYILINDIDCTETNSWNSNHGFIPIGNSYSSFTGVFNGQNYTIDGLLIDNTGISNVGLFGISNGTIKNINLTNESISGFTSVGGLVGINSGGGTIINAHTAGIISGIKADIGGLVGLNTDNSSVITNSSSVVNIDSITNYVGGLVGENADGALISNSYVTGQVSVSGASSVGGLVGYLHNAIVKNSYANELVTGYNTVGGLVGYAETTATIINSYSSGSVLATGYDFEANNRNIGGLIGNVKDFLSIYNSFTTSPILFISNGLQDTQVTPLAGDTYIGNFIGNIGDDNSTLQNNFYDKNNIGQNYCIGDSNIGGLGGSNPSGCDDDADSVSYYQGNNSNSPLDTWNFNTIWRTNTSDYPTLNQSTTFSGTGTGTNLDPYIIDSCNKFEEMNNPNISSSYFTMTRDLDCRSKHNNIMVGTDIPFSGHFSADNSGKNYTLTVDINDTISSNVGVFQKLGKTTDNNGAHYADISDFNISGSITSANNLGSIAGTADMTYITRVTSDATLNVTGNYDESVGGLVGYLTDANPHPSTILQSSFSGSISAPVDIVLGSVGGLVGSADNNSTISKSYASANINIQTTNLDCGIGGLVGCLFNSTITKSYVSNESIYGIYAAGFAAVAVDSDIENSYSNSHIISDSGAAGFVSYSYQTTYRNDYSAGTMHSNINGSNAAGFILYNTDSNIYNSFSAMQISGFNNVDSLASFIGSDGDFGGSTYDNDYVDQDRSAMTTCISNYDTDCSIIHEVNIDGGDPNYFFSNSSNSPLNQWDFNFIWDTVDSYPILHTPSFNGGNGTQNDPYQISTCRQFIDINSNLSANYILNNDLNCAEEGNNIIIDRPAVDSFTGSFDGQNHSINIKIDVNPTDGFIGLFRNPSGATIKNLNLTGSLSSTRGVVGALAGLVENNSTISNISSSVEVSSNEEGTVGGLIGGLNNSTLSNSYSIGAVNDNNAGGNAGGLVGSSNNNAIILNSYATGSIFSSGGNNLGGLVGYTNQTTISNSYANGFINCDNGNCANVGGFVGNMNSSTISNSFSTGKINNASITVGGFAGSIDNAVTFVNDYDDQTNTGQSGCIADGSISGCNIINTDNSQSDYFLNNSTNAPLDTWDFATGTPMWTVTKFSPTFFSNGYDDPDSPIISAADVTNVTPYSVRLNGSILNPGGANHFYFEYGLDTDYTLGHVDEFTGWSGTGNFTYDLTNLSDNSTYHYRFCADNPSGSSCSNDVSFRTLSSVPSTMSSTSNANTWYPDGPVYSSVVNQNTGEVYIGGDFRNLYQSSNVTGQGVPVNINSGLLINDPQIIGTVNTSISDNNGGWYVGGTFNSVGGQVNYRRMVYQYLPLYYFLH